jgi:hypothetical protein
MATAGAELTPVVVSVDAAEPTVAEVQPESALVVSEMIASLSELPKEVSLYGQTQSTYEI